VAYRIGEVAKLAHVSVRTLHHYDALGLLNPSHRSDAGHRLYASSDLERLQAILLYKELGFGLEQIRDLMASARFDRRKALVAQRELVAKEVLRLQAMLGLIDQTLAAMGRGQDMSKEEMFAVFGDFDPSQYEQEVKERWGHSEAYRESARRTGRYTKEDWQRFRQEAGEITRAIASLLDAGVDADDPLAMDAAEQARLHIDRWFYPCSHEMHVCLGEMYVADPRYAATYEKIRPGMAQYMCDAIKANAARGR